MGEFTELTAADGHVFSAYKATPAGDAKGGLVVIQEIFGVNSHIQDVCERYAEQGYLAIAPALFDRISPDITLNYESEDVTTGIDYKMQVSDEQALLDIDAARAEIANTGNVNVVGYCWGGSLAYLCACRLPDFNRAVGYYGGQVAQHIEEAPQIPVMLHFGDQDASIPLKSVDAVMTKRPDIPVYIYQAGHGFNCDQRGSYDAASAKLAQERTLAFFD